MQNKIAVTGNPEKGLAQYIHKKFEKNSDFFSRSNGYDFDNEKVIENFCNQTLNYDIFLNNSALHNFKQTILLKKVYEKWQENNKKGKIINISSTADRFSYSSNWIYPVEKTALRQYSCNLSNKFKKDGLINVSLLSITSLDMPKIREKHPDRKLMLCEDVVEYIDFIIKQPYNIVINEISIDVTQN